MGKKKPDPNKIYVCVEPFFTGGGLTAAQGARLRGSERAVREYFGRWVEDGTPQSEWPEPRPIQYYQAPPRAKEIPVERQVRARRGFTAWVARRHHVVARGAIYDREHPVVKQAPAEFESVPQPIGAA